jgi:hypothetical protein
VKKYLSSDAAKLLGISSPSVWVLEGKGGRKGAIISVLLDKALYLVKMLDTREIIAVPFDKI